MEQVQNNTKILIRELSPEQYKVLESYKRKNNHKTNTKAILSMIEQFNSAIELAEDQKNKITDLERELRNIKNGMHGFFDSFEYLKSTINKK